VGPQGLGRKKSKLRPNEYSVQTEKLTCTYIHKAVLCTLNLLMRNAIVYRKSLFGAIHSDIGSFDEFY
jgi:hypothetical protein